jgi:hypothetical protein
MCSVIALSCIHSLASLAFNPFKCFYYAQDTSRRASKMSSNTSTTAVPTTAATWAMPSADSNPRVVVTTHAADGTSIFGADSEVPLFWPFGPAGSSFAVFSMRRAVPVNNSQATGEYAAMLSRCPPSSVIPRITNIADNFTVLMH